MATKSQSEINLVITGNSEAATKALSEVSKMLSDMATVVGDTAKSFTEIGQSMSNAVSTVSRDSSALSTGLDGISKTSANVTRSLVTMAQEAAAQTKAVDLGFEEVAKTVQDSSIGIVSEIDGVNRTIGDMASVLTRTTVLMNKQLSGLRSEFKGVAASIKTSADESATASEHMHKALDFASLMVAGQEFKDFGEKIVGFFAESVKSAAEFSQSIANTRAALDAQPEAIAASNAEMKTMQNLALQLGASGFYSANQVAEAMSTLARNGLHANSIMQGAIQQTANVAAANQQDIDDTAMTISDIYNELGSNIVKQFHGNITQAFKYIGNVMTRTLHSGKISMTDLFNTMKYAGSTASNAGMSFADLGGAIALLGSHAIRSSSAGTTLRRMLTNLTPQSKAATTEMKQLGMITANGSNIFYTASGKMKSMATVQQLLHDKLAKLTPQMQTFALKTIFGQYALNGMSIIANESPAAFQKLEKSMTTTGATMDALKDREKGWAYTWMRLQAEFKTIQKEIGLALKPAVDVLTTALNKLMNGWDSLSPGIKMAIIGFTGLLGVVSLLTGVFFSTVATFGFLTTGFGEGMVVLGALGTRIGTVATSIGRFATQTIPNAVKGLFTMTTAETEAGVAADSMFGIWGIVIAGVIAGVVLLITHWKQVTSWIKQNFGIDIPQTLNQLKQVFTEVWSAIKNAVDAAWNYIEPTLKQGLQALSSLWKAIWPNLRDIFTAVWDVIKVCIAAVAIPLFIEIKTELSALEASWKYIWATIGSVLKFAWDVMSGEVRVAWDILSGVIRVGLDVLNGNWGKAWSDLKTMVQNVWNDMKSLCSNAINDIKSIIVNAVHGIVAGFTGGFKGLVSAAQGVWNTIKGIFGQHISGPSVSMSSSPSPGSLHGKIPALAEGGIVSKPTLALVGEAGYPEAVVPLKNGVRADSSGISPLPRNIGSSTGNTINFHPGAIVISVPNGNANTISSALKTQLRRALQ